MKEIENKIPNNMEDHLSFFERFCWMMGLSYRDMADILHITSPSVAWHFKKRSFDIKEVLDVVKRCGYAITFNILRPGDQPTMDRMENYVTISDDGSFVPTRLAFLWVAMGRYGFNRKSLSEKMGVPYVTVKYWAKMDNCTIKNIYAVAAALDAEVHIKIIKKSDTEKERGVVTRFSIAQDYAVLP